MNFLRKVLGGGIIEADSEPGIGVGEVGLRLGKSLRLRKNLETKIVGRLVGRCS